MPGIHKGTSPRRGVRLTTPSSLYLTFLHFTTLFTLRVHHTNLNNLPVASLVVPLRLLVLLQLDDVFLPWLQQLLHLQHRVAGARAVPARLRPVDPPPRLHPARQPVQPVEPHQHQQPDNQRIHAFIMPEPGYAGIVDELRTRRVAEQMREELSELIRYETSDPRIALVEVSEVIVAADLHRADVLVSLPNDAGERAEAMEGLEAARHYLRRKLMQRMDLFRMPELRFRPNSETASGAPLNRLLRRVRRGRPRAGDAPAPE